MRSDPRWLWTAVGLAAATFFLAALQAGILEWRWRRERDRRARFRQPGERA